MTLTVGSTVNAYAIEREVGRGGMGIVYLARDTRLDRQVAIKALPEQLLRDAERLARFEREAKIVASLNHPGIAAIHALEEVDGKKYLVMEFVDGETLAARLQRGALPVEEALAIARQIAEALEVAHEKGIVHRDLKPGNVMVTADGAVKVLDFGLARDGTRRASDGTTAQHSTPRIAVTEEGHAVGTPGYMSPEQARGRDVDRRTDIFAFGCVLFECLTGRAAFEGDSSADAIAATLEREPDWNLLPARTPARVRDLLDECLAKDPKRRLRDIGDARLELERAIERREWRTSTAMKAAPAARRSWKLALPWAVAALAILGSAALAWRAQQATGFDAASSRLPVRCIVNDADVPHHPQYDVATLAISADGSTVVYRGVSPKGECLYVRRLSDPASTALAFDGAIHAHSPVFSPDGRWIAFAAGLSISKIPTDGGRPVQVFASKWLTKGHCWTARGIIVSESPSSGLVLVPPDGGPPTQLTTPDAARDEVSHRWPDALPDGRHVLYTVKKADITTFDDADIALLDLESGRSRTIIEGGTSARYASTGHIVYARGGAVLAVPFDAATGELRGAPVEVVQGVLTAPGSGAADFAFARDTGTLVYVRGVANVPRSELVWIGLDGTITPVGAPQRFYVGMSLSPDGTRVASWVLGATDSVYVDDLVRGTSSRLTFRGNARDAFWSRDGKRVAFTSDLDGPAAVYIVDADGTGPMERLTDEVVGPNLAFVDWGGSEAILFQRGRDLMIKRVDAPAQVAFTAPFAMDFARVSPDGRWLAYNTDDSGQNEVYVRPYPTGEGRRQVSSGGGMTPLWLPGSDGVVYADSDWTWYVSRRGAGGFDNAHVEKLFEAAGTYSLNPHPDGARFVALRLLPAPPASGRVEAVLNWFEELRAKAVAEPR